MSTNVDYYDIMVIGNTGQGKSTTADKILIANPTGHKYKEATPAASAPAYQHQMVVEHTQQLKYTDITIWLTERYKGDFETHLKFLVNCRTKDKPHEQVNKTRSASSDVFKPTKDCEVLSNETSKIRVMDVPGFFDGASILSRGADDGPVSPTDQLDHDNLDIMRKIVRIQTSLAMKFKRILYFLPVRGPLERISANLKLELKWMAHFFGTTIFKTMVLVATVQARWSKMAGMSDEDKFPEEDIEMTKNFFRQALEEVFSTTTERPLPDPPLIFISLTNTCEEILDKVKKAAVEEEGLHLQIDPNTCAVCGVKIGIVKGKRVTCYFGENFSNAIPYEESTCHPYLIPKYSRIDKIWGGFKHVVTYPWTREPWPVFVGEKCVACGGLPNTRGCKRVQTDFKKWLRKTPVDHTNVVDNPVENEPIDEDENVRNNIGGDEGASNGISAAVAQPLTRSERSEQRNGDSQGGAQGTDATLSAGLSAQVNIIADVHPNQSSEVASSPYNSWADMKGT